MYGEMHREACQQTLVYSSVCSSKFVKKNKVLQELQHQQRPSFSCPQVSLSEQQPAHVVHSRRQQSPASPTMGNFHLPFPVSCYLSLSICLCLLLSLCPVARRWSFPSGPRAFLPIKEKIVFPLYRFRSLHFACLVLFFFHSTCTRGLSRCS